MTNTPDDTPDRVVTPDTTTDPADGQQPADLDHRLYPSFLPGPDDDTGWSELTGLHLNG